MHVYCVIYNDVDQLRLVGGIWTNEGHVEINYRGVWGKVCADHSDIPDARVVCRELGFPGALSASGFRHSESETATVWLNKVRCRGNEYRLKTYYNDEWDAHNCGHAMNAWVVCQREYTSYVFSMFMGSI